MARPRRSSIERQLDEAIEAWVADGLVEATGWTDRPLLVTKLPSKGVYLDLEAVERVLKFFLLLRQLIGRWAGREFRLLDWQVRWIVGPVFGIKSKATGLRVIRTVWIEIPRKNGKSTLCSGLALYMLMADREPAAQVFAAAGDRSQAGLVFMPARMMALGSPAIADRLGKAGIRRALIEHPVTGSIFRALSSDGARQHGLNVHAAIVDEVHVHKSPDLIDALETGTGSRDQPLVVFITTSDDGADGTVYATKREYFEGVAKGTISAPTYYGVLFGADAAAPGFDPFSDAALRQANPGADVTVLMDYLRSKAEEARQSPAQLNRYLRLHLNIRTRQTVVWLPLDAYDATGQIIRDDEWRGMKVHAGLDLSSTTDFTAFTIRGRNDELGHPVRMLCWIPEERIDVLEQRLSVPLRRWVDLGFLRLTEGNVVDYAKVREDILADADRLGYTIDTCAYDPWNSAETVQLLEAEGIQMVPCRQGYSTLSAPAKQIERQILGSSPARPLVRTGGNPLLRWMVACVEVRSDDQGNIKPVKPHRAKSLKRIDGVVAWIMAEREDMADVDEQTSGDAFLSSLTKLCPSCGHINPVTAKACLSCRATMTEAS